MPHAFPGAMVLFTGTKAARNVMVQDFTSMYPTIIKDDGISPECIDWPPLPLPQTPRFDRIAAIASCKYVSGCDQMAVACVVVGVNDAIDKDPIGILMLGDECDELSTPDVKASLSSALTPWVQLVISKLYRVDITLVGIPASMYIHSHIFGSIQQHIK